MTVLEQILPLDLDTAQPENDQPVRTCSKGWADRCARAKSPRCRCKCGGHNHGNPAAAKNGKHRLDKHICDDGTTSPLFDPFEREALSQTPDCRWCSAELCGPVIGHPHDGGWTVPGLPCPHPHSDGKWWLYIVCPKCDYQWALWKLGVSREWQP
jgi:hypothetical protein